MRKLLWESIKNSSEFKKITRNGEKVVTPFFILFSLQSQKFKLGVVASRKVGCAVERNRAKRLLRTAFSETHKMLNKSTVIIAKNEILNARYSDVKLSLKKIYNKAPVKYNFD